MTSEEHVVSRHQQIVGRIEDALERDESYIAAVFAKLHWEMFGIGSPATASIYALSSQDAERFFDEFEYRCNTVKKMIGSNQQRSV